MSDYKPISQSTAPRLTQLASVRCPFVADLAWSPDGQMLALAHAEGVSLWSGGFGGKPDLTLEGHEGPVKGLAFSPDSHFIATGSADTTVRLWMTSNARRLSITREHTDAVNCVLFSPTGSLLVSAGGDQRVKLLDMTMTNGFTLTGHTGEITSLAFGYDGAILASGGRDKVVYFWDVAERKPLVRLEHDGRVTDLATSPDGKLVASTCRDGFVRL